MSPKIGYLEATIGDLEAEIRRLKVELEAAEEVVKWVPSASMREPVPVAERKGNLVWVQSPMYKMCVAYDKWREVKGQL